MTDRELMQQALEALNRSDYLGWQVNIPIIKALRERLAQPVPTSGNVLMDAYNAMVDKKRKALEQPECNQHPDAPHGFNRESSHSLGRYVCDCEGWEPEPVAWSVLDKRRGKHWYTHESKYTAQYYANLYSHRETDGSPSMVVTPLYTAPPKREWLDLTAEEINKAAFDPVSGCQVLPFSFARSISKVLMEKNFGQR